MSGKAVQAEAPPHPREVFVQEGAEAAEAEFLGALHAGRLHHAWLLTGPEGVGKATFAYRAARRLLGARPAEGLGPLGAAPDDPVSRLVVQKAHPDLLVLEREAEDGKPRKFIPVDEARRLPEFFSKAPGAAPYRVAVIDAADDMNVNAANAILKTLEEPPPKGVLLLVSHAPGRLLATIRSRCRRLAFGAWSVERTAGFVRDRTGLEGEDARRIAEMSGGAPGKALELAARGALEMDRMALSILRRLESPDLGELQALADGFRGAEGQGRFELFFQRLADHVRRLAVEQAGADAPPLDGLDRMARDWEMLSALPAQAEALNLDRADAFWTALSRLRRAA